MRSLLCLCVLAGVSSAGVIHVDASVVGGAADGSSWADAFPELQSALAVAAASDDIWVAEGTYRPDYDTSSGTHSGNRGATFRLSNGVRLLGGFPAGGGDGTLAARDLSLHSSVLSGDIGVPGDTTDNSYHVVTGNSTDASAVIDGFVIRDGRADGMGTDRQGGGMELRGGSATVLSCVFTANHAQTDGGGMVIFGSPLVANCLFVANTAGGRGGGIYNDGGSQKILCCTVVGNTASSAGGLHFLSGSSSATNSVVWGNTGGAIGGQPSVTYSCIEGGFAGTGNIANDPQFVDMAGADLRLLPGSPCIDMGTNGATGLPSTDLDGKPRIVGGTVDMGAYEKQRGAQGEWLDLGGGTTGVNGPPTVVGDGALVGGTPVSLTLTAAPSGGLTLLWVSFQSVPQDLLGGTIHALPFALELPLFADGSGMLPLSSTWPQGLPAGTQIWFQFLLADATVTPGITLSNALRATTP
ncbi:MAG: choice-of-anchor Q domain-containing protein [Planctomycetota bacterium]